MSRNCRMLGYFLLLSGLLYLLAACGDTPDRSSTPAAYYSASPLPFGTYTTAIIMNDIMAEPLGFSKYLGR